MRLNEFLEYTSEYFKRKMKSEKGTWVAIAIGGSGLATAGTSAYLGSKNKPTNPENMLVYKQLPDYDTSTQARKDWAGKLNTWGSQEGYGAIPENWDEIWNTAKNRISRYYWGGVNDPGLAGKIRASAARRGVSQSPALENQLATLGFQEGIDQNALTTDIATKKAEWGETGRQNWLANMANMAQLRPAYVTGTGVVNPTYGGAQMAADLGGGVMSLFSQYQQSKMQEEANKNNLSFFKEYMNRNNTMPMTSQSSLVNTGDYIPQAEGGLSSYFNQNYAGFN